MLIIAVCFAASLPSAADASQPSDDFRIGPHRDCRELLLRSIRTQARTCDSSKRYAYSASQGYLLATIGITLQLDDPFFDPYRRELVDIALGEIEELISVQDRVRGGGPAFGLDYEYDAFQDGSSNPAFTAYTWNSGMTAWGGMLFLDALKESPELEPGNALRYFDLISGWIQYWEPFFTSLDENGAELGYFWYSDSENDADKAVHNTSALIAMAADHWRALRPGDPAARRLGAQADAFFRFFKARLTRMPSGGYTWNYWDDGLAPDRRRAEDTAHALIETQLIRHMESLGYFPPEEMPGFEKTLMRQVWMGDPVALAAAVDGSGIASRKLARTAPILYATLADRVPNSSLVWETGKSILFSTYLSEHRIDPETGSVDSVRSLALARFLQTRPGAPAISWTAGSNESNDPRFSFPGNQWPPPEDIEAGYSLAAVRGKANASWSLTFPESETPAGLVVSLIWAGRNEARITASSGGGAILSPTLNEKGALRWHRTTFATTGSGPVRFSIDHSVSIHRIVVRRVQPNHPMSTGEAEDTAASPANGSPAAELALEAIGKEADGDLVVLLEDTGFAEGFGAAFIYGSEYTGGRRPPLGEVTAYRDISPWQIHLIPDGPVKKVGVKTHPWDFQEGLHHNFTDSRGNHVRELHGHRLVVNHVVEVNTPEKLQFAQFNNYGLPKWHPDRDKKLVKRVITDREGTLTMFYNSKNEIRNKATGHSARWAKDTWPHFLVNQRFLQPVSLADYRRMDFSVSYRVDKMNKLSNWPNHIKGAARSGMNLKYMFFLRNQSDLDQKLFAGMMLYTSREKSWQPHVGVEQHGQVFYRESIAPDGRNIPVAGETRTVNREIKSMLTEALRQASEKQPHLSANVDDYALYNFSIGFEGMGHWESEAILSGLSFTGMRK